MKYSIIYVLAIILISSYSCTDVLDVENKSGITSANMWQSEGDINAAVYGTYKQFRATFATNYAFWGEYRNGLWGSGSDGSESYRDAIYLNKISSNIGQCNWASIYTTINNCNLIIKYIPSVSFSNEKIENRAMANALYVRAFCYYWIARIWGDAPLLLVGFESDKQEDLFPSRTPVEQLFSQVEADIDKALSLIPEDSYDRNMASKASLNCLKADYCMWMAKVEERGSDYLGKAKIALEEVIGDLEYELQNDFSSIFANKLNNEIIFAWSLLQDEFTGGYPDVFLEALSNVSSELYENPVKVGSVRQRCFLTGDYMYLLASNENDTRTSVTYETYFDEGKGRMQQWINKFVGTWTQGTRIFDSDIIVYRLADVILLYAEVLNEMGNIEPAINELNKIAHRAYKVENYYQPDLTKEEVDEIIILERMKEFVAEGKLWWDFIRFGVVFEKVPALVGRENERNILLWPIADGSINSNPNIIQTEFDY